MSLIAHQFTTSIDNLTDLLRYEKRENKHLTEFRRVIDEYRQNKSGPQIDPCGTYLVAINFNCLVHDLSDN